MRWDAQSKELRIPALASFGSKLEVRAHVDFLSHTVKNIVLEPDTELSKLSFKDGIIENSILRNVTAVDLNLGDVAVETVSLAISQTKLARLLQLPTTVSWKLPRV